MDNAVIDRICTRAFMLAFIGVCIAGVCPAFSIMSLASSLVLKSKGVELSDLNSDKIKKANFLAVTGLVMFAVDVALGVLVYRHFT